MQTGLLRKYDRQVPRYTSYPTAPHFGSAVGPEQYRDWLAALTPDQDLSLYLHFPFCSSLCWFCGCNTRIVARYAPVAAYLETLVQEIAMVAAALGRRARVSHMHWGGGTPTILKPGDVLAVTKELQKSFDFATDAEFAVEIDPREIDGETVAALAQAGVNRVSLGVQDVNRVVQDAVNRRQPWPVTEQAVAHLRANGIDAFNIDLMYGLPFQTVAGVCRSVESVLSLEPNRLSLFGYAHVPWMKAHQRLIDESALPGLDERAEQFQAAADRITGRGYVWIGLDHFARADDALAVAARQGRLSRNFQGYTTDAAAALIGIGASAIGALPQGHVQNSTPVGSWRDAIASGRFATAKGCVLGPEDRLRGAVIERLMCDLAVDLEAIAAEHDAPVRQFLPALASLAAFQEDGIVTVDGFRITVAEEMRGLVRNVAAVFDTYLGGGAGRHARAV